MQQAVSLGLVPGEDIESFWRRVAATCSDWLAGHGAPLRDAVLLLPFAQQLAPARRAFLARGGWQPLLATTRSLASALGPTPLAAPGHPGAPLYRAGGAGGPAVRPRTGAAGAARHPG